MDSQTYPHPLETSGGQEHGTTLDQLHILKNAIEKALDSQMYSPDRDIWLPIIGTIEGQLHILNNAIEQAVDSQTYPHPGEASGEHWAGIH